MDVETDINNEIEHLEYAAAFLKARANSVAQSISAGEQDYDFEKEKAALGAATCLEAAAKLQGRANMLRVFGRDYDPTSFIDESVTGEDTNFTVAVAIEAALTSIRVSPVPLTAEDAIKMLVERLRDDGVNVDVKL